MQSSGNKVTAVPCFIGHNINNRRKDVVIKRIVRRKVRHHQIKEGLQVSFVIASNQAFHLLESILNDRNCSTLGDSNKLTISVLTNDVIVFLYIVSQFFVVFVIIPNQVIQEQGRQANCDILCRKIRPTL